MQRFNLRIVSSLSHYYQRKLRALGEYESIVQPKLNKGIFAAEQSPPFQAVSPRDLCGRKTDSVPVCRRSRYIITSNVIPPLSHEIKCHVLVYIHVHLPQKPSRADSVCWLVGCIRSSAKHELVISRFRQPHRFNCGHLPDLMLQM